MPISKRAIIEQVRREQDLKNKIIQEIVTFLERSGSAFTKKELSREAVKFSSVEESYLKSFIHVSALESLDGRIKTHSEGEKRYYYISY